LCNSLSIILAPFPDGRIRVCSEKEVQFNTNESLGSSAKDPGRRPGILRDVAGSG
jgi:hypothetical protein